MSTFSIAFSQTLIEILNGTLAVSLLWMLIFLVIYFVKTWRETRERFSGPSGIQKSIKYIYKNYKAEIALFVIVFSFCVRTFLLWYVRWMKNNDISWSNAISDHAGEMILTTTATLILGVLCWIRVMAPCENRTAAKLWLLMISTSLAFGIGMNYFF